MIGGQKVGEIIPFPVWIIPFPVFKYSFGFVFKSWKLFVKEVFFIGGQEVAQLATWLQTHTHTHRQTLGF